MVFPLCGCFGCVWGLCGFIACVVGQDDLCPGLLREVFRVFREVILVAVTLYFNQLSGLHYSEALIGYSIVGWDAVFWIKKIRHSELLENYFSGILMCRIF